MHFCLQLDKLKHISYEEFERLNWLPVTYRFKERVNGIVLRYFNEQCPNYQNEVFDVALENNFYLRGSFQKLKCPLSKTNTGQLTSRPFNFQKIFCKKESEEACMIIWANFDSFAFTHLI